MKGYISKIAASILALTLVFAGTAQPLNAKAAEEENKVTNVCTIDRVGYSTLEEAIEAAKSGDVITLEQNIDNMASNGWAYAIDKTLTLDMNGHKIEGTANGVFRVQEGAEGENLKVVIENGTIINSGNYGILNYSGGLLEVNDMDIQAKSDCIRVGNGGTAANNGTVIVNGDKTNLHGGGTGIVVIGINRADKVSKLVINAGTITGSNYGITGNGVSDNTDITINNAVITSGITGIYHPQIGELTIGEGAEITAANGLQFCGEGTLKVEDGKIRATYKETEFPNKPSSEGDGTVNDGAAISIVSRGDGYQNDGGTMKAVITGGEIVSDNNSAIAIYRLQQVNGEWVTNDKTEINSAISSLDIKNGTFTAPKKILNVDAEAEETVNVTGGTFSKEIEAEYVAEGYKAYPVEGKYKVAKLPTGITLDKTELSMEVNTNEKLQATVSPEGSLEEVTYTSKDTDIASVDSEGNVTAKAVGETTITAKAGGQEATCKVHVYEIKAPVIPPAIDAEKPVEDVTVGVDKEQAEIVDSTVNSLIEDILSGNDNSQVSNETKENIKQAIENGEVISTEVKVEIVNAGDLPEEEVEQIKAEVGNGTIAEYLNLEILLKSNQSGELGTLDVLSEEMTFTIAIPEELQKDGRTFFIVRIHEGNAERIDVTMNQDGTISFVTDRFSTYALAYEDEVDNGSDTEDDKDDGTNDDVTGGNNDNNSANSQDSNKPDSVKTGDPVNTMTIVNLVVLMAAAITTILFVMKRKLQK